MSGLVMAMLAGVGLLVAFAGKGKKGAPSGQAFAGVPNEIAFRGFGLSLLAAELCPDVEAIDRAREVFALGAPQNPTEALLRLRETLIQHCPAVEELTMAEAEATGRSWFES